MIIIMLGPPGSGKDTQAQILAEKHGFTVISAGEALREAVEAGNTEVAAIMKAGELVSDEKMDAVLHEYIKKRGVPERMVFTGIPRRVHQVELIDNLLNELGQQLAKVVYLHIPDEEVVERISGRLYAPHADHYYHVKYNPPKNPGVDDQTGEALIRRPDDEPGTVRKRLEVFHAETEEILAAYEKRGQLVRIDGTPSIAEVAMAVENALELADVV